MKKMFIALFFLSIVFTGGCAKSLMYQSNEEIVYEMQKSILEKYKNFPQVRSIDPTEREIELKILQNQKHKTKKDKERIEELIVIKGLVKNLHIYNNDEKLDKRKEARNQIISELMMAAKAYHEARDDVLLFGRASINSFFETSRLLMELFSTISTVEQTKTIFSAIASAISGVKQSIDTEFFYEQTTGALLSKMQEDRIYKEWLIKRGMTIPVKKYDLDTALMEVVDYSNSGGITDALRKISVEAELSKEITELSMIKDLIKSRGDKNEVVDDLFNYKLRQLRITEPNDFK